jgi:hypothetical protein
LIICTEVLKYPASRCPFATEIARVLKSTGTEFINAPNTASINFRTFDFQVDIPSQLIPKSSLDSTLAMTAIFTI